MIYIDGAKVCKCGHTEAYHMTGRCWGTGCLGEKPCFEFIPLDWVTGLCVIPEIIGVKSFNH